MKSRVIAIKNIPQEPPVIKAVELKPVFHLIVIIIVGLFMGLLKPQFILFSICLVSMGLFCLMLFPNRRILAITEEYIILYNQKNRRDCFLAYWDEIVFWRYIKQSEKDELEIELINHRVEVVECFSKSSVIPWVRMFAFDKERRSKERV